MSVALKALEKLLGSRKTLEEVYKTVTGRTLAEDETAAVSAKKRATVFLAYNSADSAIAHRIADHFLGAMHGIWPEVDTQPGADWADELHHAIDAAVQRGFVLLLLSAASLKSQWCRHETERALARVSRTPKNNIVPILVGDFDRSALPPDLGCIQYFDLNAGQFDDRMRLLHHNLETREME